jgi:hypothetical protein
VKQRLRYSWQNHRWDGKLLTPEQSEHFASLSRVARDRFIATIVSNLRAKEDAHQRRTAHYRAPRA